MYLPHLCCQERKLFVLLCHHRVMNLIVLVQYYRQYPVKCLGHRWYWPSSCLQTIRPLLIGWAQRYRRWYEPFFVRLLDFMLICWWINRFQCKTHCLACVYICICVCVVSNDKDQMYSWCVTKSEMDTNGEEGKKEREKTIVIETAWAKQSNV